MKNRKKINRFKLTPFISVLSVLVLAVSIFALSPILFGVGFIGAALFTPSPIMGEIRKKAGSDVFSKNHYGNFIRKVVKPINPKSTYQTLQRGILKTCAKAWAGLTIGQRLSFSQLGKQRTFKNVLGGIIHLTGNATYNALNSMLLTIDEAAIDTAPAITLDNVASPTALSAAAVHAGAVTLTYAPAVDAAQSMAVYSSGEVSPGKNFNSKYNFLGVVVTANASPFALTSLYNAKFGAVSAAGNKIFFKVKLVDWATGFVSAPVTCDCITT
jgi:hypothetical protein